MSLKKIIQRAFFIPLLSFCSVLDAYQYDLAVCAIFQNEASYLKEWIEFHKLVGVQHFYLYNNLSTDDYLKVLQPYMDSGEVDLIEWEYSTNLGVRKWDRIQIDAYNHALGMLTEKVKWVAFIDTDEFLFPVIEDDLNDFLSGYEDFGAVCVNWQMYGTSNVYKVPSDHLLIEDLVYKAEVDFSLNRAIKSIIRPDRVKHFITMHECKFKKKWHQVNSDKKKFDGRFTDVLIDKVRINHYWTRDGYFLNSVKIPRYRGWGRSEQYVIDRASKLNDQFDDAIHKYVPRLKFNMGLL